MSRWIGPPDHTTSEWRRIWSVHKYKNKRKRLEDSDSLETECNVRLGIPLLFSKLLFNDLSLIDWKLDHPSCSASTAVEKSPHESSEKLDIIIAIQSEISAKMDVLITNQEQMTTVNRQRTTEFKQSKKRLGELGELAENISCERVLKV